MQAQLLQTMQQTLVSMQAAPPQAPPPPPRDRLREFQRTKPPTFSQAMEPMDADDWLKSVEKNLRVVQCSDREKVLLASHQLSGPAADWWAHRLVGDKGLEDVPYLVGRDTGPGVFEDEMDIGVGIGSALCEPDGHTVAPGEVLAGVFRIPQNL